MGCSSRFGWQVLSDMATSDRPLRVCLVSAAYRPYPSGVSEHVYHLAEALRDLGQDVRILTTSYGRYEGMKEATEKDKGHESGHSIPRSPDPSIPSSIPVTRIGRAILIPGNGSYTTLPSGLGLPFQVPLFLRRHRIDLIHCHGAFPLDLGYWALTGTRIPAVVTFHTLSRLPSELLLRVFRSLFTGLNRRISARIAVSQAGSEYARRFFPGDYRVIPNGVDLDRFRQDAPVPAVMRGDRPTVLYVGRFDRRKGLSLLLQAMPQVIAAVPSVRLIAVGGGLLEVECRQLARDLGIGDHVSFPGRATDEELPGYYAGCTVFCSPATGGEAMGIVLIEAMAAGRPVVASDIAGYNEVVTTGVNGLLVPAGDPAALSAALNQVLLSAELRATLSSGALARAREFAWPGIARRIEQVYREVV
jgi:phosphatidylinositol alpha-mannosyltransferase